LGERGDEKKKAGDSAYSSSPLDLLEPEEVPDDLGDLALAFFTFLEASPMRKKARKSMRGKREEEQKKKKKRRTVRSCKKKRRKRKEEENEVKSNADEERGSEQKQGMMQKEQPRKKAKKGFNQSRIKLFLTPTDSRASDKVIYERERPHHSL
jgi:hypothetical protein